MKKSNFCHVGVPAVFKFGKTPIYAGRQLLVLDKRHWGLVVACDDSPIRNEDGAQVEANTQARAILPKEVTDISPLPIFRINWPDMGVPSLSRKWWITLFHTLKSLNKPVAVCCYGGHGRTGTALACLAGVTSLVPKDKDPVEFIRKVYCEEAVETWQQITYIENVTGRQVLCKPSGFHTEYTQVSQFDNGFPTGSGNVDARPPFKAQNSQGQTMEYIWDPVKQLYVAQPLKSAEASAQVFMNGKAKDPLFYKEDGKTPKTGKELMDTVFAKQGIKDLSDYEKEVDRVLSKSATNAELNAKALARKDEEDEDADPVG